ncbi:MAG: DEAD/DEAH box helicase [Gemmatimonadota bacterium]
MRADPPTGRVLVIAPTRAACETIELALSLHIETFLEKHHGERVRELARAGRGFGIIAGTGTGKTLAVRPIAEEILKTKALKVGVVNREREATPETPTWNVIIITTGIARRWFEEGDILASDTLVVDEIHQTSAELELCLALGKRARCRFVWLSATVDPTFYREYLESADVLEVVDFDESRAAHVKVLRKDPIDFLDAPFLQHVRREKRGVAMFVPTRRGVEEVAAHVTLYAPGVNSAYYHGGEPIRILRPFLEGGERKPFFLAMTAAGQSALNVRGLDTVVVHDKRFYNNIDRGRNVLTQEYLGSNEILQMAGRVHGRVEGGRVFILSDRDIHFASLRPTAPDFQLAGDSERVAMTCAALGVRADELDLPVPLDKVAYRRALSLLEGRGIVENGRLTPYGRKVEALPVERAWAELLVNADDALVPFVAVMASIESLHRMTREERDLTNIIVPGSDHLTAYNLYAEAFSEAGSMGEVYGLPRHMFDERAVDDWAAERGVLVKSVEDAAVGMASVYRAVGLPLPATMTLAGDRALHAFQELLAAFMPFTLVIDEETIDAQECRVSKTSVCGSWGAIAGDVRYFADKFGVPRASVEGTQVPMSLIRKHAREGDAELIFDGNSKRSPLLLRKRVTYHGFELARENEPIEDVPASLVDRAIEAMADAVARGEARHPAVSANDVAIEEIRESWRRSGGRTAKLGREELAAIYRAQLAAQGVHSVDSFRRSRLTLDADAIVPRAERERYLAMPDTVEIRGRAIAIRYDVEETASGLIGVIKLQLPEKVARNLAEQELPGFDRPVRFVVTRGARGAARADTLDALRDELDRPFTPEELAQLDRAKTKVRDERNQRGRERNTRDAARELRHGRKGGPARDKDRRRRRKGR